jgi:hypothetical protein
MATLQAQDERLARLERHMGTLIGTLDRLATSSGTRSGSTPWTEATSEGGGRGRLAAASRYLKATARAESAATKASFCGSYFLRVISNTACALLRYSDIPPFSPHAGRLESGSGDSTCGAEGIFVRRWQGG